MISPNQSDVLTVLRSFLLGILPNGIEVVKAQDNRVPEPSSSDFVVMTPIHDRRLATNIDLSEDVRFTGSISGNTMTVSSVNFGSIEIGSQVFGIGLTDGTVVTALGTGSGGAGTYTVSPPQTIPSEVLSAGNKSAMQEVEMTIQLDLHGPNSHNNAQTISTLFRDEFATSFFDGVNDAISPLYADDPRQTPFLNAEQQIETRWVVEAVIQVNQTVTVPQQYADSVQVTPIDVDASYPP